MKRLVLLLALIPALSSAALADSCAKWENEVYVRDAVTDTITTQIDRTGGPFACVWASNQWFNTADWHNICYWQEQDALARPVVGSWAKNFAATAGVNLVGRGVDAVLFSHDRPLCGTIYKAVDKVYVSVLISNGLIAGGQLVYRIHVK